MEKLSVTHDAVALTSLMTEDLYQLGDCEAVTLLNSNEHAPVVSVVAEPTPELSKNTSFNYLGDNNRYVVVLVNYPNHEYIADGDKEFLLKVISALKMDLKDIAIVNMAKYPSASLTELHAFFAGNKIISFNIDLNNSLFKEIELTPYAIKDHLEMKILAAEALNIIGEDNARKKSLWNALKIMFNVA
ncbi:hypothetical protein [Solitalea koreensis]|uniref:Uncharacterized protein n=1 Tax=Solitalea koreensis TaxID=543615 RepID=A0A521ARI7_9SPHI|nr:hypothetical protein [Solitalea koreensis]SMO37438.1 hypothetical protein SAMN06265350_101347 [Solitalea koreensis]